MDNIKVSVVIPVYNVEKYLEECLDSIVSQSLRETEIICVNDGSTDGSPEILQKYAAKDKRITVCTQENRGVSAARNKGVAQARGKYLYFMDSDDILELSALEILYEKAESDNLDVLCFDGVAFTNDPEFGERVNRSKTYTHGSEYNGIYKGSELLSKMAKRDDYIILVWLQFINRNYYVRNKLGFNEELLYSEDFLFSYQCILTAERVRFLPLQLYRRRFRSDSLATKKMTFVKVRGRFLCYLEMNRFYKEHHIADTGDKMLFKPVQHALSSSRSFYRDHLPPEERQKVATLPDEQRQIYQTLVVDVCNKRDKAEARKQKLLAPFARLIALKNSVSSKIGRK